MKFNLETPMIAVDGTPIYQGKDSVPVTLRNVLHMALSADAIFVEGGPAQGSKRPLTQHEQMQRVGVMQLLIGNTLDITVEQAAQIKDIAREGLSAMLSLLLAVLIDGGGNVDE